jgi:hypothetical protein
LRENSIFHLLCKKKNEKQDGMAAILGHEPASETRAGSPATQGRRNHKPRYATLGSAPFEDRVMAADPPWPFLRYMGRTKVFKME